MFLHTISGLNKSQFYSWSLIVLTWWQKSLLCLGVLHNSLTVNWWSSFRLKLSPSPSPRVAVSRITGSSSSRSKRKRVEAKDVPEVEIGEGQLLVSEEATASGAVTISPTDMDGNAVTLVNETGQVCKAGLGLEMLDWCISSLFRWPRPGE